MIVILQSIRTLLAYVLLGLPSLILFGWLLPKIDRKERNYAFCVWFAIDVAICSIAHGTYRRTISGWTGQHMSKQRRYYYQAMVINYLLSLAGDGPNHCQTAFRWESRLGLI